MTVGAEMLTKSRMKVQPFISAYRKSAICAVIFLFAQEIIMIILRTVGANVRAIALSNVELVSAVIYVIVCFILSTCYIICAVGIWKKLQTVPGTTKKRSIRRITWRMTSSAAGYIAFVIISIFFAVWYRWPWGRMICLNLTFVAHNWAATMQVLATRARGVKSSKSLSMTETKSLSPDSSIQGESVES